MNALYECEVDHVRRTPIRNRFRYATYLWLVDVDDLPRLPWLLRPLARFVAGDHLDGSPDASLRERVDARLAAEGIDPGSGTVRMLAAARVFRHVFNPLSVYWCHRADGTVAATLIEVHNTYGERHCYVVHPDDDGRASVDKALYVSPFEGVEGRYDMRLAEPDERLDLSITLHRPGQAPFVARLSGTRHDASPRALARLALRHPFAPLMVSVRIRRQGIGLWARRLRVVPRPSRIAEETVQ
ncbi:MAG TPA: DUF1365 domain-containing protein [Microthrixaceae bacterium]|nr:DUF1365 domain-containing protein [Microthrixaceae bacterium]